MIHGQRDVTSFVTSTAAVLYCYIRQLVRLGLAIVSWAAQAPPPFDEHRCPFEKNEHKKFPKLGLLNYPKRICNNPNPNPAMLQSIVYLIIFHRACCSEII